MGGEISYVEPGGIADELGWQTGDYIVSMNGHVLEDVIDYRFYESDEYLLVTVKRGDQVADFEIEKDPGMSLGVEFREVLFDGVRTCGAHCLFCFVEQLPRGLRRSLYLKDDDYRLSFLDGNFVTLGNVTQSDLDRIVEQGLSPLYISVHTTDPDLREHILGRKAPHILDQIDFLSQGGITMHTQIVLCRGINDGDYLERSISDLCDRYPGVASLAVVPAGVTEHRRSDVPIHAIDAQYSAQILDIVARYQKRNLAEMGTRIVWAADEFYLNAAKSIPPAVSYEGFPQLENGVGLVRQFKDSRAKAIRLLRNHKLTDAISAWVVTAPIAAPLLREFAETVKEYGINLNIVELSNTLFGNTVTVAGLMSGKDVLDQLRGKCGGDILIIPEVALRDGLFLDDVSIADIERELRCSVLSVEPRPFNLIKALLSIGSM